MDRVQELQSEVNEANGGGLTDGSSVGYGENVAATVAPSTSNDPSNRPFGQASFSSPPTSTLQQGDSPSTDATNSASITMSAGADPWAEPSAFAPQEHEMRKVVRDNPWATNSPVPELVEREDRSTRQSGTGTGGETHDDDQSAKALQHGAEKHSAHDQVRYTLVKDNREGEYDLPKLGKPAARYWMTKAGYLNVNNGGYGACPKPVLDAVKAFEDQQEELTDHFRYDLMAPLTAANRERVAKIVHCGADEIVFIPNATTATNAVLRDLVYKTDDAILTFNVTYGAVVENIRYLIESEQARGVRLHQVNVTLSLPATKEDILSAYRSTIDQANKEGKRIRVAVVDPIASRPGVRLPWEAMVAILRQHGILSLVDGAHAIGQIPLDLNAVQPDFFVSNCHKWMYAHRGCAVFYVPHRNRHLQRSSFPTSFFYTSNPTSERNSWQRQWLAPGTEDMASRLSVGAALDFRESLGGEARIMNYNHDLAVRGGRAAAKILGTEVMDLADHSMTASMVNVRLPLVRAQVASGKTTKEALDAWSGKADRWFFDRLFTEFKTFAPVYLHDGKPWARFSAQVWLEVDDFEYVARALLELCKRINAGQVSELQV